MSMMDEVLIDCFEIEEESSMATPPMFFKYIGRGKEIPVDPRTIRLPKCYYESSPMNQYQNLRKNTFKNPQQLVNGKIKIYAPSALYKTNSKLESRNSISTVDSVSTCSSTDDVSINSLKDKIEWPEMASPKVNPNSAKDDDIKSTLSFKSIGKMLCDGESSKEDCYQENGEEEEDVDTDTPEKEYKLFIQNIPNTLSEDELVGALSNYGTIQNCKIYRAGGNHSMALLNMDSKKACDWAISCLHGEESPFPGYPDGQVPNLSVYQIKENGETS